MAFSVERILEQRVKLQVTVCALALLGFVLAIARVASSGATPNRLDIWLVVVVSTHYSKPTS